MLYICVPAYNEAPTIGLLLWRIRKVFEELSREYEIIVLDDGSTDATPETLQPYPEVLPLTILRNDTPRGYAAALEQLIRTVAKRTRYPRRDAAVFMQGDFTDQPEFLPELVKPFEGGADLVVAEQTDLPALTPPPVRHLRRLGGWLARALLKVDGVGDVLGSYRLVRISVLRDVLKDVGDTPLFHGAGWAVNAELVAAAARFARRVETVPITARYDLRTRDTRVRALSGALDVYRAGRTMRARRAPSVAR